MFSFYKIINKLSEYKKNNIIHYLNIMKSNKLLEVNNKRIIKKNIREL